MAKRTSKTDVNEAAFEGMQFLLEKLDPESLPKPKKKSAKAKKPKNAKARKTSATRKAK